MIIRKPKPEHPNATILTAGKSKPRPTPPSQPQPLDVEPVSAFEGFHGLRRNCERLEANIEQLASEVARNGAGGANGSVLGMFKAFSADTQTLLDGMPPGPARARVAAAAKRDGKALMNEAATTLEIAERRNATTQIAGIAQGLAKRVAADPARLGPARETIAELTGAADLPVAEADAVMRQSFAAIEAAMAPEVQAAEDRTAAGLSPLPGSSLPSPPRGLAQPPAQVVSPGGQKTGQTFSDTARRVPRTGPDTEPSAAERRAELAEHRQGEPNADAERPAQRNSVLEAEGFAFVRRPEGGFWIDAEGARVRPDKLRTRVAGRLETRANKERWSSTRFLQELNDARQGLPRSDQRNIETAFVLAPFVPFIVEGASAAVSATVNALLAGAGVAAYFGVRNSELLDGIEPADDRAEDGRPEAEAKPSAPPPARTPAADDDEDDDREKVTVYRVEGEENQRLMITPGGGVVIVDQTTMLFLNFGQRKRAEVFLKKRLDQEEQFTNPVIKSFRVPRRFFEELKASAIPEFRASDVDPQQLFPRRVDKTKAEEQFGLPPIWIRRLDPEIDQTSGKVETPEEAGIRR